MHKQVAENALRGARTGSGGADFGEPFGEPPDLTVGPPSPSPWQRRGGGSNLLMNEEDDDDNAAETKESLSRHEAAGRGQNLLLQVAQMNEAAAASVQAIHASVGNQGSLLTNGSSDSGEGKESSAPLLLTSSAADASGPLAFSLDWRGALTPEQLTSDARDIALGWSLQSKPAAYSSLVSLHVCYDQDDDDDEVPPGIESGAEEEGVPSEAMPGADGQWTDQFLSLSDASLWAATHFNVNGATGAVSTTTPSSSVSTERFKFLANLRSPGCAVTFERCPHSSTGFCVVVHQPYRGFTLRLALKKFKPLLDWGAALLQAMSELPPPSARDTARQAQPLSLMEAGTGGAQEANLEPSNTPVGNDTKLTLGEKAATPLAEEPRQNSRSRKRYSASAPRVLPSVTEEERSAPQGEIEALTRPSAQVPWAQVSSALSSSTSSSSSSASSSLHTFGDSPDGTNPWGVVLRPVGSANGSAGRGKALSRPISRSILLHHQQQQRHNSLSPSRQLSDRSLTQRGLWMTSYHDNDGAANALLLDQSIEVRLRNMCHKSTLSRRRISKQRYSFSECNFCYLLSPEPTYSF